MTIDNLFTAPIVAGSGAKEQADRPGLAAALAAVEDSAEALVVYRLDRLARHLVVQETILEQLGRKGRRVFSVSEADIDDTDPTPGSGPPDPRRDRAVRAGAHQGPPARRPTTEGGTGRLRRVRLAEVRAPRRRPRTGC